MGFYVRLRLAAQSGTQNRSELFSGSLEREGQIRAPIFKVNGCSYSLTERVARGSCILQSIALAGTHDLGNAAYIFQVAYLVCLKVDYSRPAHHDV